MTNSPQMRDEPADAMTHFGFQAVPEAEKASRVRQVFESVAGRYDLMNDLMSGGVHRLWKASMLTWLMPRPNMALLDVGGGTGDIAFGFRRRGGGPVTVCDINREMLSVGRDRALNRGLVDGVSWVCGDAERLPFPDCSFDAFSTAFCLRNVTRLDKALAEARRVLKPGGRFLCLEFSKVEVPLLRRVYDEYSFRILPTMGRLVASDRDSYQYLVESIRRFPDQETFAAAIASAGLGQVKFRNLSGGIAALHSAWRT